MATDICQSCTQHRNIPGTNTWWEGNGQGKECREIKGSFGEDKRCKADKLNKCIVK